MLWPGQKGWAELSHSHLFAGSQAASLSSSPSFVVVMGSSISYYSMLSCPGPLMGRRQAWITPPQLCKVELPVH